jgi:TOBE domain
VVFDGFSIARERVGPRGLEFSGHVTFSLRPQNIGIARRQAVGGMPHDETLMRMPATILEAAFFGEYWEYVVALAAGAQRLRVVCRPNETFDAGQEVLLNVDPRQMAPVA